MTCKLVLKRDAKKEWDKLDQTVRSIFAKKLKEHLQQPCVEQYRQGTYGMAPCRRVQYKNVR